MESVLLLGLNKAGALGEGTAEPQLVACDNGTHKLRSQIESLLPCLCIAIESYHIILADQTIRYIVLQFRAEYIEQAAADAAATVLCCLPLIDNGAAILVLEYLLELLLHLVACATLGIASQTLEALELIETTLEFGKVLYECGHVGQLVGAEAT